MFSCGTTLKTNDETKTFFDLLSALSAQLNHSLTVRIFSIVFAVTGVVNVVVQAQKHLSSHKKKKKDTPVKKQLPYQKKNSKKVTGLGDL
jgi:hypothetical protein